MTTAVDRAMREILSGNCPRPYPTTDEGLLAYHRDLAREILGAPNGEPALQRTITRLQQQVRDLRASRDDALKLLAEARKIVRASASRNLAKDWDRRATARLGGAPMDAS